MSKRQTDPYAVLGLLPGATKPQISHAYRALLREHHPDTRTREPGKMSAASDAALQEILSAYAVLGDATRRAEYDALMAASSAESAAGHLDPPRSKARSYGQPPIQAGPVHWQASQRPSPAHPRPVSESSYPEIRVVLG